jgi:pimeloyl-ACP methyl ester carboxylesterase
MDALFILSYPGLQHFISYRDNRISYRLYGKGTMKLVCLHGYGESSESFALLENSLGLSYTIVAIDLPSHGDTTWNEPDFHVQDLSDIIQKIIPVQYQQIALMGYSMGGRIALHLLQQQPEWFNKVVLLAADGLQMNRWYWLATQSKIGHKLFRFTMQHPRWLFMLAKAMHKTGLLKNSIFKLLHFYMDQPKERMLLYDRWMIFRHYTSDLTTIATTLKQNNLTLDLVFGKYDQVIPVSYAAKIQQLSPKVKLTVLPAGHRLLQQKYLADIAKLFIK